MPEYQAKCPGAIETHWIPMDPKLWKIENYEKFLEERRKLLAQAANSLLDSLYHSRMEEPAIIQSFATKSFDNAQTEEEEIDDMTSWMEEHGLNTGVANHQLVASDGTEVAIIDLAWPQGIQVGLSEPIALLLNESAETQAAVSKYGYRYFTSTEELKSFITNGYLS